MAKVLIIEQADGTAGVVHLTPEHLAKHDGDGVAALESIQNKVVPGNALSHEIVDTASIPGDRTFRDSWEKSGSAIQENMPKARVIHMDRIRAVRNAKLDVEDKEWNKAADQAAKDVVEARRATLRSIPNSSQTQIDVDAAADTAALDAIWPTSELGARE